MYDSGSSLNLLCTFPAIAECMTQALSSGAELTGALEGSAHTVRAAGVARGRARTAPRAPCAAVRPAESARRWCRKLARSAARWRSGGGCFGPRRAAGTPSGANSPARLRAGWGEGRRARAWVRSDLKGHRRVRVRVVVRVGKRSAGLPPPARQKPQAPRPATTLRSRGAKAVARRRRREHSRASSSAAFRRRRLPKSARRHEPSKR
jgi:hypothetical protein